MFAAYTAATRWDVPTRDDTTRTYMYSVYVSVVVIFFFLYIQSRRYILLFTMYLDYAYTSLLCTSYVHITRVCGKNASNFEFVMNEP